MAALRPSSSPAALRRRKRIVDATRDLLRERDAHKVIVVDIAERAGVSPATVYNLVGTRDEVIRAVLEDVIADVAGRADPVDPDRPADAVTAVLATAAEVLLEDALAYRRAIGAMSDSRDGDWLQTTIGDLVADRLTALADAFDGSIATSRLAELIHIGFRGVLISWSYGHLPDERLASSGVEVALHILDGTARPDLAADIRRRLITLAKEAR